MKRNFTFCFLLFTLLFFNNINAQTTTIPDNNFENFLETHDSNGNIVAIGDSNSMGDGIDDNDLVLTSNISSVTQLFIDGYNIEDFEGLQQFTSLTNFSLTNNQANPINKIDFYGNIMLADIHISSTPNLSQINILKNPNLVNLYIVSFGNVFNSIDVSANFSLVNLTLSENALSILNLTTNLNLKTLSVRANPITSINVSKLTELQTLLIDSSLITSLDISKNTNLTTLWSHNSKLTEVNLKNGFNTDFISVLLDGNPDLSCILVDNKDYSNNAAPDWLKDSTATYVDIPAPFAGSNTSYPTVCSLPTIEDLFDELVGADEGGTWLPEQVDGPGDYIYTVKHDCYPSASATVTVEEGIPDPDAGPEDDLETDPGLQNLDDLRGWSGNKLNSNANKKNNLKFALADESEWASVDNKVLISKDGDVDFPNTGAGAAELYSFTFTKSNQCGISAVADIDVYVQGFDIIENITVSICENETVTTEILNAALIDTNFSGEWTSESSIEFGDPGKYNYLSSLGNGSTSTVTVTSETPLSAGTNTNLKIAIGGTVTEAQLFNKLQGEDGGGTWSPLPLAGAGTYTYTHEATIACPAQSAEVIVTESTLSVYENEFLEDLLLYPNPTNNILYIKGDNFMLEKVEIYSTKGQQVLTVSKNLDAIDLSNLKSTLYFVKLHTENATKVVKIIKK